MKKILIFLLLFLNIACQYSNKNEVKKFASDTELKSKSIKQKIEQENFLPEFYLSYDEWKSISCILSSSENAYWDKSMIGLIEKSGLLRIEYLGKKILLKPIKYKTIEEGIWTNTFKNDSIQLHISINFDNKKGHRIIRSITGNGSIQGKIGSRKFDDKVFCVYELDK
jgi:hypothetical protein